MRAAAGNRQSFHGRLKSVPSGYLHQQRSVGHVGTGIQIVIARISTSLDTDAERAWRAVQRKSTFLYVTKGVLGIADADRYPEEWHAGDVVRARLVFFGFLPGWMHELRLVRVDGERRELYTNERGGVLSAWNHCITVEPAGATRCRYTDEIDMDAGLLTPLVWLYAHIFFRYRQMRLRRLARTLT